MVKWKVTFGAEIAYTVFWMLTVFVAVVNAKQGNLVDAVFYVVVSQFFIYMMLVARMQALSEKLENMMKRQIEPIFEEGAR